MLLFLFVALNPSFSELLQGNQADLHVLLAEDVGFVLVVARHVVIKLVPRLDQALLNGAPDVEASEAVFEVTLNAAVPCLLPPFGLCIAAEDAVEFCSFDLELALDNRVL